MDYFFFRVVFFSIIFTNSRQSAIGFTPGVFQGVFFEVMISFVHSFGIIVKKKCSPFNHGIIHQPIMSINKVITPMTELSDPPSYKDSTNPLLFKAKISSFKPSSVKTVQPGFCRTWAETEIVGFVTHWLKSKSVVSEKIKELENASPTCGRKKDPVSLEII